MDTTLAATEWFSIFGAALLLLLLKDSNCIGLQRISGTSSKVWLTIPFYHDHHHYEPLDTPSIGSLKVLCWNVVFLVFHRLWMQTGLEAGPHFGTHLSYCSVTSTAATIWHMWKTFERIRSDTQTALTHVELFSQWGMSDVIHLLEHPKRSPSPLWRHNSKAGRAGISHAHAPLVIALPNHAYVDPSEWSNFWYEQAWVDFYPANNWFIDWFIGLHTPHVRFVEHGELNPTFFESARSEC